MQQFIGTLFHSRTQAHVAHLQTSSFAKHKALNEYYDEIVEKADTIAEQYQGKYGIIEGYQIPATKDLKDDELIVTYFEKLSKFVAIKRKKLPQEPSLQALIDEVQTLVDSTLYKLKYLK